jgi:acyl-CoA reductase-like NAD-dependent aldehyde dehydrogenase
MSPPTPSAAARSPELPPQRDLIAGAWVDPAQQRDDRVEDPNTGEARQAQARTAPDGIEAALAAADALHRSGEWRDRPAGERAEVLSAYADALEPRCARIAELEAATTGATVTTTSMLSFIVHAAFRLAAQQLVDGVLSQRFDGPTGRAVEVERVGWGPAVLLVPWNAPAPMAAHKAASALAAGCPVIIKPPERAPHGTAMLGGPVVDLDLPAGLVQVVHGGPEVGGALVTDPRCRAVSFTGGIDGGRAVAVACAQGLKPVQLELGGHSPLVVLPDADVDAAADAAVALLTTLNGQWCRALGRLLVPADREGEILDAVLDRLAGVQMGHSCSPGSQMGPMVHSSHLDLLGSRIDELTAAGGTAHAVTKLPDDAELAGGNWLAPTLVTGVGPSDAATEIFGPVATVHSYDSVEDAVSLANGTEYGLEAYVVGADEDAAMAVARRVVAGGVKVNGASPISLHLMAPRPAWGVSGLHDEGTVETIEFFGGNRVVGVEGSL